jgi:hypothetical protein
LPSTGSFQPSIEAIDFESGLRERRRPLPFGACLFAQKNRADKGWTVFDRRPEGFVVGDAVAGRLREQDVEDHRLCPLPPAEIENDAVHLSGPGPAQSIFLFSPIQAVLIEEDQADVAGCPARFCQQIDPPVPGLAFPPVEPTRKPECKRDRKPENACEESLEHLFHQGRRDRDTHIFPSACWKRC